MKQATPEQIMRAHQYLYYVECDPAWSDWEYDLFCRKHGLEGGGGSDLKSSYDDEDFMLALAFKYHEPVNVIEAEAKP